MMPAALAVAEAKHLDGRALLLAFILGNEVGSKLGQVMTFQHYEVGFHPTGTLGDGREFIQDVPGKFYYQGVPDKRLVCYDNLRAWIA